MSLKERIMAAVDLPLEKVEVPEWDCPGTLPDDSLYLRSMSAGEVDRMSKTIRDDCQGQIQNKDNFRAWLLSFALCDHAGNRVFDNGDHELLSAKNSAVVQRLFDRFTELNGMSDKAVDELGKNCEAIRDEPLPSDLHLS